MVKLAENLYRQKKGQALSLIHQLDCGEAGHMSMDSEVLSFTHIPA